MRQRAYALTGTGYAGSGPSTSHHVRRNHRVEPTAEAGVRADLDDPPCGEHGTWTFAGFDAKRSASK